jgi:hypothetical protein
MNGTITFVSPLVVFPRSNMKAELLDSAPPGSIAACHKAGWIQERCFTQRFKYFVRFVKMSRKGPVILTLDGHYSHSRNIEMIDCARETEWTLFAFPRITLLDFSYVQPLKTYYAQETENLLKIRPNRVVTHHKITGLVEKAYLKSATAAIAAKVFRKTGLFLCKRHMCDKHDGGRISAQQHQLFA